MTESGGTTGISFCINDSRGCRMCDSSDREGFVIKASADNSQKKVLVRCSVRACRSAGMTDQDDGAGSTRGA
jgi:hypothetical protein